MKSRAATFKWPRRGCRAIECSPEAGVKGAAAPLRGAGRPRPDSSFRAWGELHSPGIRRPIIDRIDQSAIISSGSRMSIMTQAYEYNLSRSHDALLIVLPEMVSTGYCWLSRKEITPHVEPIPGPTTSRFQELATRYGCYITVTLPEVDPATQIYYNSVALLGPEGLVGVYRKTHSYIAEPRWARDGDLGFPVWETSLGRLGALICMDAVYFETARIPALHQADVILFPTNWLDEHCPSSWWMARALENGVYFIAANRYGRERGTQFSGGSCILNPDGSIQSYLDNGEGIVYGEVDLERCRDKRWGSSQEIAGDRLADRRPPAYATLVHNSYLWEPLRYHSLYGQGELPTGQLSCVGIMQMSLETLPPRSPRETIQALGNLLRTCLRDNAPARPDVVVLPELLLPGPVPLAEAGATIADEEISA